MPRTEVLTAAVDDHNSFALALYGTLHPQDGNLFVSPFSVRTALAMTYAGARGETAIEMRRALCMSVPDEALHLCCADMVRSFGRGGGDACAMAVANALWSRAGVPLEPAFVDLIERLYGSTVNVVDFEGDADAVRSTVNQWAADRTGGRISGALPPGLPRPETRLMLVNAAHFKAKWTVQFDKERTRVETFYPDGGGQTPGPLMRQYREVGYWKGEDYQAVELTYEGDRLSMLVILPDRRDGLRDLEKTLSARTVNACLKAQRFQRVEILLPRFKIAWGTIDLRCALERLGMRSAFIEGRADLSGINGRKPPHQESLLVTAVLHKACAEVNEEGTEAATATVVMSRTLGIMPAAPPTPIFRADHPFLFVIRDRASGAIAFIGRVVDPSRPD